MLNHLKYFSVFIENTTLSISTYEYALNLALVCSLPLEVYLSKGMKSAEFKQDSEVNSKVKFHVTSVTGFIGLFEELPKENNYILLVGLHYYKEKNQLFDKLKKEIEKFEIPILIIKRELEFNSFKEVVVCSDFEELNGDNNFYLLRDLILPFKPEVKIVHVKPDHEASTEEHVFEAEKEINYFQPYFESKLRTLFSSDIVRAIKHYVHSKEDVNLVAISKHRHGKLHDFFITNHTHGLIENIDRPILIM